jgi:hydrogenase expression/formation protein HypE
MTSGEIERCRDFLTNPGISIRKEAEIAASSGTVTAMHDVTEGGLSTALEELSIAGRHRIRVFADRIPILDETAKIGRLLGIQPLGLIGSGSMLIRCAAAASDSLIKSIRIAGIDATWIGEILEEGTGIEVVNREGEKVAWPRFEVDEVARFSQSSK